MIDREYVVPGTDLFRPVTENDNEVSASVS